MEVSPSDRQINGRIILFCYEIFPKQSLTTNHNSLFPHISNRRSTRGT
jgi:hypothetical protein